LKEGETISKNAEMGKRIRSIRKRLGKNQEEFGQLFDPPAPKSSVSYWENGGGPNKQRLKKIAELGGVSVEYLINGSHMSAADTKQLLDKAVHGSKLNEEEQRKITESQIEFTSVMSAITSKWESTARSQFEKQQDIIKKNPLSVIELLAYDDFLILFNLIRLHGTDSQQEDYRAFLNLIRQIAVGTIQYDKADILPNVDKLLSSFPIKKDDSDESN
jgi:transcriptional regulator with XRE-family HTH domain